MRSDVAPPTTKMFRASWRKEKDGPLYLDTWEQDVTITKEPGWGGLIWRYDDLVHAARNAWYPTREEALAAELVKQEAAAADALVRADLVREAMAALGAETIAALKVGPVSPRKRP